MGKSHAQLRTSISGAYSSTTRACFPRPSSPGSTLHHYYSYRNSRQAWLLGRFVCPVAELGDLLKFYRRAAAEVPVFSVTALARQSPDVEGIMRISTPTFGRSLTSPHMGEAAAVDVLELTLPRNAPLENPAALPEVRTRLREAGLRGFLEIPRRPTWRQGIALLSKAMFAGRASDGC